MNLGAFAINNKITVYFAAILILLAGAGSYFRLGQLEDPKFSVKTAVIQTAYPGATAEEVELEVTDRIETAIQEMDQIKYVESFSRAGLSFVRVEMLPEYWSDRLPQIFDELRRKVQKAEVNLPPGAGRPQVFDDYGQVFGLFLAITGEGFSYAELEHYAKALRKELSRIKGLARVDFWGVQEKVIYLDASQNQLTNLGLSDTSIVETLQQQNMVVDAGGVDVQNQRYSIQPTGSFRTPADIAELTIRPSILDTAQRQRSEQSAIAANELIRIRDIGTIRRGYREPPAQMMRLNGQRAIGIAMAAATDVNIVALGETIDQRLEELEVDILPVGIELHRIHWQSTIVDQAVMSFFENFGESLLIVLVVVTIPMGWRIGFIIGTNLVLTVLATFVLMTLLGIDLHRISLGALIIALGMMVDNAIVVADEIKVKMQQGLERTKAATESVAKHQMPLLFATGIAVMAFFPIAMSPGDTGEYCQHLFYVAGASLLASWLLAITVTPLQCVAMLPDPKQGDDPYGGKMYQRFRGVLDTTIRFRWITLGAVYGLVALAMVGFGNVEQLFFPNSSMPKFMIDFYAPYGTRIQETAQQIERLEEKLLQDERVDNVATFVGAGPPRFYLPVQPEDAMSNYAQVIVNVHDFRDIEAMANELVEWTADNYSNAVTPVRMFAVGPGKTWKFDLRISGPAETEPDALRAIAAQGADILLTSPDTAVVRVDWQNRIRRVVPEYNRERGRWSNVTRDDIAKTTKRAYDGRDVGLYREGDDLIPIVLRYVEEERQNISGITELRIKPELSTEPVPLSQVTDGVRTEWIDPMIWRRDRRRTIKLQANPVFDVTLPALREQVEQDLFNIPLPPGGYALNWGGETEDSADANAQLIPGIIPAAIIMLFILVAQFNAVRPPTITVLTIPLAIIGVVFGLLLTQKPFGFIVVLGVLSLVGMVVKNVIVLLEQIRENEAQGMDGYLAIREAAVSRLRPVLLTSATTFLGVLPLYQDVLWQGLSVAICGGLAIGTVVMMVFVPVLYATLYGRRQESGQTPPQASLEAAGA